MTAGWLDDVRDPPGEGALATMATSIVPGGHVAGLHRLGGGLGASTHAFRLETPTGEGRMLVLRRYPVRALEEDPKIAERSWRTLHALSGSGITAPEPVWADLKGYIFGTPAYVTTLVPGDSSLCPSDPLVWITGLAEGLAALHRTRLNPAALDFLEGPDERLNRAFASAARPSIATHPLGSRLQHALDTWRPRLRKMVPVLCHGDYWGGNTLWQDGRMVAIIDWDDAALGYPGLDVGYCRMDLSLQRGYEAAGAFLLAYEAAAGMRIPQLHVWDLLGAAAAMPDPERWLPGFHELGRSDLTPETVRERLTAFTEDALRRSGA